MGWPAPVAATDTGVTVSGGPWAPAVRAPGGGYGRAMSEPSDENRVERRADLLPEEVAAGGSEDPEAQAAAILEESDDRTDHPEETRHDSTQTLGG